MLRQPMLVSVLAMGMMAGFTAPVMADGDGVITGKAIFKGDADAPENRRTVIDTSRDPNCAKMKGRIGTDNVILNRRTDPVTVRNVLVSVRDGLGERTFAAPETPAVLDQKGCHYEPHVLALMEGQPLVVRNSDDTNHNIHFQPKVNERLNFSQPQKDMEREVKLRTEDAFHVKCDVHPWMGAYIAVFNHPFFSVTDDEGKFELKGLPPGKYVIEAWHETFGTQTATVEIGQGDTKEIDFTIERK